MRQLAALLPLLCLLPGAGACAAPTDVAPPGVAPLDIAPPDVTACAARLDAAVRRARGGDERGAEEALTALVGRCGHLPQIHHDLGVLAARAGRLPEALARFEAALAEEPRASMTLDHLRALHRREAALGYARALGTSAKVATPSLTLQDSRDVGADTLRERLGAAGASRRPETLESVLHAWWRSAGEDEAARRAHYVSDFPKAAALAGRARDAAVPWDDVRREIAFTAEEAVAVLASPGADGSETRRLLLLRLDGERWKIYRETPL